MSFPRYESYKDSGVEWLGEVPAHWAVERLKFLVTEPLAYGANEVALDEDPSAPRFVRITDIDDEGNLRDETFKSLPSDIAEPFLLDDGDVLLARSGATVGKTFIYKHSWGVACFAGYLIRARCNTAVMHPDFLYAYTQSESYWSQVKEGKIQTTIQNFSAEKYGALRVPVPPGLEQQAIAAFLDHETARIDALITEQRTLIELLKEKRRATISHAVTRGLNPAAPLKDSGVEWLGEVPAHWSVTPVKRKANIRYGIGEPPRYRDEGVPLVRATNVHAGQLTEEGIAYVDPGDIPEKRIVWLSPGDIIVVRSGAYTGDSAIVPPRLQKSIAGFDMVLQCHGVDPYFVQYALLGSSLKEAQIDTLKMRAAQPHLNAEELGSCLLHLPPTDEQQAIVAFLDHETARIDALITEAESAIALLQERRSALISAAVTGQIDVRGRVAQPARQEAAKRPTPRPPS